MSKMNSTTNSDKASELTLRDLLAPLFRHSRVAILTFCVVFGLCTLLAWVWAARYYRSTMEVLVEQDRSDPAITSAQNGLVNNVKLITADLVTSEVSLLQGEDMLRNVAATCGLDSEPSITDILLPSDPTQRRAMKNEGAARNLEKKIKVEAAATSDVIDVSFGRTGDPEIPACVLKNLGKLYLEKHLQLQRPAGSSDFFAEQTEKYRKALAQSEALLVDFGPREGVGAPDLLRGDVAQEMALTEAALDLAVQNVAADNKRIQNIKSQLAAIPSRSPTAETSNSPYVLMQNLQAALLSAQVKKTQLLLKYKEDYPLVREVDEEIAETQQAIKNAGSANYIDQTTDRDQTYEFLRQDQAKTEADLASHSAQAQTLTSSVRNIRKRLIALDGQAVKQAALVRDAKANEANYLLYLNKREQELTSDALDKRRIANVAIAVAPVVPLLPAHSPWLVMFVGLILAVFSGGIVAYVAEYLDPSFRTPEEVIEALSMPVLAAVPRQAAYAKYTN